MWTNKRAGIILRIILFSFLLFLISLSSFTFGVLYSEKIIQEISVLSKDNVLECNDPNFDNFLDCINNNLTDIYKYNISQTGRYITEDELIESGGVCIHYADWYFKEVTDKGYYAKRVIFDLAEDSSHAITIASTRNKYCILDQTLVTCFDVG